MSLVIDFNTLKFNLYEILNISSDSSEHKIKKAFRHLIINFHPDKNNKTEEDIYYHIITANQILLNKETRQQYDAFLNTTELNHFDLKKNFNNQIEKKNNNQNNKLSLVLESISNIKSEFNIKVDELNKKHNYDDNLNKNNILQNYEKLIKDREVTLNIPKENIENVDEFNYKFESNKDNGSLINEIITMNEEKNITTYNINDNYTSLDLAFNNLYIEGELLNTNKYSSLNSAFKLQPKLNTNNISTNIKDAMQNYKNETTSLSNHNNYTKDKFESWIH
jgi:curved DNA-binding protein CbpA